MKGYRYVGGVHLHVLDKIDDSAMILFSADVDGNTLRNAGHPIRARHLRRYVWPHAALPDTCYDDHVWVATAVGEDAFK